MSDTVLDLRAGDRFVIRTYDPDGAPRGELVFSGDELSINGFAADPAKVRVASVQGGAFSMNFLREDGVHEELVLINGKIDQEDPASYGGELDIGVRARYASGDGAMRRAAFFGSAFGTQGRGPTARTITQEGLGSLADGGLPPVADPPIPPTAPPPAPDSGIAVLSTTNLGVSPAGMDPVSILTSDVLGPALIALNRDLDVEVILSMDLTDKTSLGILTHRVSSSGTPPNVHISVGDGTTWTPVASSAAQAAWVGTAGAISGLGVTQVRIQSEVFDGKAFNIGALVL